MKKLTRYVWLAIVGILPIFNLNIKHSDAEVHQNSNFMNIKESTPLYLEPSSKMLYQDLQNNSLLAGHYSHYSHQSHQSHYSHYSHQSHYSG